MPVVSLEQLRERARAGLPGLVGIEIMNVAEDTLTSRLVIREELLAPNGYLHAGTLVTLADTSCGFGCFAHLPPDASGFATIELKVNFLGTALEGALRCVATRQHAGRTTEVWDAAISEESTSRAMALFRCTQLIQRNTHG